MVCTRIISVFVLVAVLLPGTLSCLLGINVIEKCTCCYQDYCEYENKKVKEQGQLISIRCSNQINSEIFPDWFDTLNTTVINELKIYYRRLEVVSRDVWPTSLQAKKLDLSFNKIVTIEFKPSEVTTEFRASWNKIEELNVTNFPRLTTLYLDYNNISNMSMIDLSQSFMLQNLYLNNNVIEYMSNRSFEFNSKLVNLDLSYNLIGTLSLDQVKLPYLEYLSLEGNSIEVVHKDMFGNMSRLKLLRLSKNPILDIHPSAFRYLSSLTKVVFFSCQLQDFPSGLFNFSFSLNQISLSRNNMKELRNGHFKSLKSLTKLTLYSNKLELIEERAFADLVSLEFLDLSEQDFSQISFSIFRRLINLSELNLNNNSLRSIPNNSFVTLKSLKRLNLGSNFIDSIERLAFSGLNQLVILNLADNSLEKLNMSIFSELKQLRTMNLSFNRITAIENTALQGLVRLEELNLGFNKLEALKGFSLDKLPNLKRLNLSHNRIATLDSRVFLGSNLTHLDLSDNHLYKIEDNIFSGSASLQVLNLSNNVLRTLSPKAFNLNALTGLDISSNELIALEVDQFKKCPQLRWLNLANNLFITIDSSSFGSSLYYLNLGGESNPVFKSNYQITSFELKSLKLGHGSEEIIDMFDLSKAVRLDLGYCSISKEILNKIPLETIEALYLNNIKFDLEQLGLFLRGKRNRNLREIDLSFSLINAVGLDYILDSKNLTIIKLAGLNLDNTNMQLFTNFNTFSQLVYLDLSENNLSKVMGSHFENNLALKYLNISHNVIDNIQSYAFSHLFELVSLDLSWNNIEIFSEDMFGENQLLNLKEINLANNRLFYYFNFLPLNMDRIDLSFNYLFNLYGVFTIIERVKLLDLRANRFRVIAKEYFNITNQIFCLYLSYNEISVIEDEAFLGLKTLTILDLGENMLANLNSSVFQGLYNLIHLNLSQNRLEFIDASLFRPMTHLKTLDLFGNLIKYIEPRSFLGLNRLSELKLSENQLNDFFNDDILQDLSESIRRIYVDYSTISESTIDRVIKIIQANLAPEKQEEKLQVEFFPATSISLHPERPYSNSICYLITSLIRSNIQVNLDSEYSVAKYLTECAEWSKAYYLQFLKS